MSSSFMIWIFWKLQVSTHYFLEGGITGMVWVKTPRLDVSQKRAPEQELTVQCGLKFKKKFHHQLAPCWSIFLLSLLPLQVIYLCTLPITLSSVSVIYTLCSSESLSSLPIQISLMKSSTIPSRAADGVGFRMNHSKEKFLLAPLIFPFSAVSFLYFSLKRWVLTADYPHAVSLWTWVLVCQNVSIQNHCQANCLQ